MGRLEAGKLRKQKVGVAYACIEPLCTVHEQIKTRRVFSAAPVFDPVVWVALCRSYCITALG